MTRYYKTTSVVHAIAQCQDCGKEWTNYKNAQAVGARHSQLTGHTVTGEVGLAFRYPPKQVPESDGKKP